MNYLLDTHTFLWDLFDHRQLPPKVKEIIRDPNNKIFVSVISFWEISLKYSLGKIELKHILPEVFPKKAADAGLDLISLNPETVSTYYQLPKTSHRDPFDRMLIWQAIRQKYTLISKDTQFMGYQRHGLKLIW